MAELNMLSATTVYGRTNVANLTTTMTNVIATEASTLVKINDLLLTNYSASAMTANITLTRGGTPYYVSGNVSVPSSSILVVIGKDTPIYMQEGDYLQANVGLGNTIHLTTSYELLS